MRRKKMAIMVFIVLAIFLAACGEKQGIIKNEPEDTKENISEKQQEKEEAKTEKTSEAVTQRKNTDFRDIIWGDDIDTLIQYEGDDYDLSDNIYTYERKVAGYDAYTFFTVGDDEKIHSAGYSFMNTYTVGSQYISQYNILKKSLTEKYGEPYEDEIIPLETQSLIDTAGESKALEYGYVVYRSRWKTNTSEIMLGMMSENYNIGLIIQYNDINYEFKANTDGL